MSYFSKLIPAGTPADNYTKYLETFVTEFLATVKPSEFNKILSTLPAQKSYRTLNREVRKACDQYCTDNKIMNHKEFQEKWFYEGVMLGRMTHGAKAPWMGNAASASKETKEKALQISIETVPTRNKGISYAIKSKTNKGYVPKSDDEWIRVKGGAYRKHTATA